MNRLAAEELERLGVIFGGTIPEPTLAAWSRMLGDVNPFHVRKAVDDLAATYDRRPSFAQLRAAIRRAGKIEEEAVDTTASARQADEISDRRCKIAVALVDRRPKKKGLDVEWQRDWRRILDQMDNSDRRWLMGDERAEPSAYLRDAMRWMGSVVPGWEGMGLGEFTVQWTKGP